MTQQFRTHRSAITGPTGPDTGQSSQDQWRDTHTGPALRSRRDRCVCVTGPEGVCVSVCRARGGAQPMALTISRSLDPFGSCGPIWLPPLETALRHFFVRAARQNGVFLPPLPPWRF